MQREVESIYRKYGLNFKKCYFHELSKPIITADGYDPILNSTNPIIRQGIFCHFTNVVAAKGILNNEIWLTSAIKRINEHEFESYYEELGMLGICDSSKDSNCNTIRDEIARTYFYLSLTDSNLSASEEGILAADFGGHNSVKFTFEVDTSKPCLRRVDYSNKCPDIVIELNNLAKQHNKLMSFNGAKINSGIRLNAFHHEKETRLYFSTTIDALADHEKFHESPFLHIKSPLQNRDIGFSIRIKRVQTNDLEILEKYPTIAAKNLL